MNNEITQEERERVLKALEEAGKVNSLCLLREIFVASGGCTRGLSCSTCEKQIKDRLIDFIKSTQYPLDKDGIEIRPGDTVYMGEKEYIVQYIAYDTIGAMVLTGLTDPSVCRPKDFSHKNEDVKIEADSVTYPRREDYIKKLYRQSI